MLDLLRKRAQSRITLILFGVVILVFIFFFGYSDLPGGRRTDIVARVDRYPIYAGEFQSALENNTATYKEFFKNEIPKEIAQGLAPFTLQQLIEQRLLLRLADQVGLRVSPAELAAKIRSLPYLRKDDQFDLVYYKEEFLPYLRDKYRIDFEKTLQIELLVNHMQNLLKEMTATTPQGLRAQFEREKTRWTFEIVTLDNETVAKELQAVFTDRAAREKLLQRHGLSVKSVGPLGITFRRQLLDGEATSADYRTLFALSEERPTPAQPLALGAKWHVVRLSKLERPTEASWTQEAEQFTTQMRESAQGARIQRWLTTLAKRAAVRRYVNFDAS